AKGATSNTSGCERRLINKIDSSINVFSNNLRSPILADFPLFKCFTFFLSLNEVRTTRNWGHRNRLALLVVINFITRGYVTHLPSVHSCSTSAFYLLLVISK